MRASETVSEASPGSTASQTGVPTQVVQQVQGTQQVGHTPLPQGCVERAPEGGSEAVAVGTLLPPWSCCPNHLLTCSYQDVHCCRPSKSPPPAPAPGRASLGKPALLRSLLLPPQRLLVQTSVQTKPGHVSPLQLTNIPVPQQVSALHPAPTLRASPGCRTHPCGLLLSTLTSIKAMGPIQGLPYLLPPAGEAVSVRAHWGRKSCRSHLNRDLRTDSKERGWWVQPQCPKAEKPKPVRNQEPIASTGVSAWWSVAWKAAHRVLASSVDRDKALSAFKGESTFHVPCGARLPGHELQLCCTWAPGPRAALSLS